MIEEAIRLHDMWAKGLSGGKKAELDGANLDYQDFSGMNLRFIQLLRCSLVGTTFSGTDLSEAEISECNLSDSRMSFAHLARARMYRSDMRNSDLYFANLYRTNLEGTLLAGANLSGATGLVEPQDWMCDNFDTCDDGWIVYKTFGYMYVVPSTWRIGSGSVIKETVNCDRTNECGCGINFGTLRWIKLNIPSCTNVWKCLIRWKDGPGIIVPYSTDGKARCHQMELLERVKNYD